MDLSFQLYSARNFQPWRDVFHALADIGYTQVEGFGGLFDQADQLAELLKTTGLHMSSAHFGIDQLEEDFDNSLAIIKQLHIKLVFCPYLEPAERPTSAAGWQAFAHRLVAIGDKLAMHNIAFGWHNHDFEFKALDNGQLPIDILLENAPNLAWEADLAWVQVGGHDPLVWIDKYADRLTAIHIKDRAPAGENEDQDGWCDIGDGVLNWPELLAAIRSKTKVNVFCVEHDNPADVFAFAQNAFNILQKF